MERKIFFFLFMVTRKTIEDENVGSRNNCLQKTYQYDRHDQHYQNNSGRITTIQKGNYTIQGILKFTELGSCTKVSLFGLINVYAIQYAIDIANKNPNLNQWASIGIRFDDNCRSLPVTMTIAVEYISMVRENSVCREEFLHCINDTVFDNIQPAVAIVGTDRSTTTIPLSGLMSLYQIPVISHAASSPLLSRSLHRSFFRTIPSDVHQVTAMLDIIRYFNWTYVIAIGSDDDYGRLAVADLQNRTANSSIHIEYTNYVPANHRNTNSTIIEIIDKLDCLKSTVVILFCYVSQLGEYILKQAQKKSLQRVWLTSDNWNPYSEKLGAALENQLHGLITVSMKRHELPKLVNYMENEIKTNFLCNTWLKNYLKNYYQCEPTAISSDNKTLFGSKNCSINIDYLVKNLSELGEKTSNLVDAVTVLTRAILVFLQKNCVQNKSCSILKIDPIALTEIVRNISFMNDAEELVQFDQSGDSAFVFYTIENLQIINGTLRYVTVGNWNKTRNQRLFFNEDKIKWPLWFKNLYKKHPDSQCHAQCLVGQYYTQIDKYCWNCTNCTGKSYSNTKMAPKCEPCGEGNHTIDHITCVKTPVIWLTIKSTEGVALFLSSSIGWLLTFFSSIFLFKLQKFILTDESSPYIVTLSCALCFLSFSFGFLQLIEPSLFLCQVQNVSFFLLIMMFSSFLIIKTKYFKKYHNSNAKYFLKGRLFLTQLIFIKLCLILEICTITAWNSIDGYQAPLENTEIIEKLHIEKRCSMELTAGKLISIFIPFIITFISTFFSFRERNKDHIYYEPKFLSFTSIALCITFLAFLPTFKYANASFKVLVIAYTLNIMGYTFLGCLILPKVYVGHARFRHGTSFFKLKPAKAAWKHGNSVAPSNIVDGDAETTVTKVTSIDSG
ncbi:extracellular calcium-sensing receptor isoform X2 [Hydra vulgaris]|uniref:Extracellular calcium-sensing receptor isoform X2 n=1 Tax=Hydra vulgaris TaxID=6087 RepID=A0ABM4CF65_HYDVU